MQETGKTVSALPFNIAPKAVLAFVYPVIAATATAVVAWVVGGEVFDVQPIKVALGGVILGGVSALGAYIGKAGVVVYPSRESADIHDVDGA